MAPNDTLHSTQHRLPGQQSSAKGSLESDGVDYIQSGVGLEADRSAFKCPKNDSVKAKYVKNDESSSPAQSRKQKKKNKKKRSSPKYDDVDVPSPTSSLESYEEGKDKSIDFVKKMGFSVQEIDLAVQNLGRTSQPLTVEKLLDEAYRVQDELISLSHLQPPVLSPKCQRSSKLHTDSVSLSSEESDDDDDASSSSSTQEDYKRAYLRAVEREKLKYRNMIEDLTPMCRVCNCSRATILLLPCGHLVSCDDCLMDVRRCPVNRCNKIVRGTKEVYFA